MDQNFPQPDFSDKSRTELQRRLDQGEQPRTILEELYRGIQSQLYRRVYASLQDVGLAKDLVQTVFMKMHASFDSMIAREPVLPWILTVADHESADRYRTTKGRFEEQPDTWVSIVEPVLIRLLCLRNPGGRRGAAPRGRRGSPRCIESPCAAHTASRTGPKANDDE